MLLCLAAMFCLSSLCFLPSADRCFSHGMRGEGVAFFARHSRRHEFFKLYTDIIFWHVSYRSEDTMLSKKTDPLEGMCSALVVESKVFHLLLRTRTLLSVRFSASFRKYHVSYQAA